jgi:hypothetical protein
MSPGIEFETAQIHDLIEIVRSWISYSIQGIWISVVLFIELNKNG